MQNSQKGLEAEIGTPLQTTLSSAEQSELEKLNKELTTLKQEAIALGQARLQAELELNNLNQELTKNLNKRKAQIEDELANVAVSDEVLTLQQRQSDLAAITSALQSTSEKIDGNTV